MYVIGTAGHIDHGKSTLIRALTGMDPDRLKEEKERGMTIDLGFAWLTLPSGREAGIVDVPGHHRFIRNMLAGASGIRLTLLVVAANDSWMPQSQEHLEILDLLGVQRGIVVLTKKDLVDEEWLALVEEDVRERLAGTVLDGAPIVAVSSVTGEGLEELTAMIDDMLAGLPPPVDYGRPRLWIDRVFTIRGAGTVVTGTLEGGSLAVDQEVEVLPSGKRARVRSVQTHKRAVERAGPGSRVAVNLAGLDKAELARGDAVCGAGQRQATRIVNAGLRVLPSLDYELEDMLELKLYAGSAERVCRIRLLDRKAAQPGDECLVQLWLAQPAPVAFGDRFVLRDPARQKTVGGGQIIDASAERVRLPSLRLPAPPRGRRLPGAPRERRLDLAGLRGRWELAAGDPSSYPRLAGMLLAHWQVATTEEIVREIPAPRQAVVDEIARLSGAGRAVVLPSAVVDGEAWRLFSEALTGHLADFHRRYPLRAGPGRETVRSHLGVPARLFEEAVERLSREGRVVREEAVLRLPSHTVQLSGEQEAAAARLMELLHRKPYSPPGWDELVETHGFDPELLTGLIGLGRLVRISQDLVFPRDVVEDVQRRVQERVLERGSVDVAALRDMLGTSRKYALPMLEYFDEIGFTRRVGDARVLAEPPGRSPGRGPGSAAGG
ncbi:MAG: selenocysteine-specific translation elongation factor [Firmicutes bacterium]|nr:selenocysteine-specific translation elongation factor [Bacillota bacterium]